eukprot:2573963-Prymnesium_polylepis.1
MLFPLLCAKAVVAPTAAPLYDELQHLALHESAANGVLILLIWSLILLIQDGAGCVVSQLKRSGHVVTTLVHAFCKFKYQNTASSTTCSPAHDTGFPSMHPVRGDGCAVCVRARPIPHSAVHTAQALVMVRMQAVCMQARRIL